MLPLAIIGGVALLLGLYAVSIYNQLTKNRILVQEGWSGIGAYLQQRIDMLPNLVEVVKGYAGHENKTLTDVIRVRNESMSALTPEAQIEAAKHMGAAMINFKSLSEEYPELKANENFNVLQGQLAGIEERLNQSRRYYNGTVRSYNQSIAVFPKNLIAGNFGFKPEPFFAEDEVSRIAPKVDFSNPA